MDGYCVIWGLVDLLFWCELGMWLSDECLPRVLQACHHSTWETGAER